MTRLISGNIQLLEPKKADSRRDEIARYFSPNQFEFDRLLKARTSL